jgi:hypothetical protein
LVAFCDSKRQYNGYPNNGIRNVVHPFQFHG